MGFPYHDEYGLAIVMPEASFKDSDLRNSNYEFNEILRCPVSSSGAFAITYHFFNGYNDWAVRCFTSEVKNIEKRYEAIGRFIDSNPSDYFVEARLIEEGIMVGGAWYPIIKMKWVKGDLLIDYLKKNLGSRTILSQLLYEFQNLLKFLESKDVAHGDLQHGNMIVDNGRIKLVDYDGVYLRELQGLKSVGTGESNYQHPKRDLETFNSKIDRFSSIVIYLSIYSLIIKPDLWHKYHSPDTIIFNKDDFVNPDSSSIFREMSYVPQLSQLVEKFKALCRMPFSDVPTLEEFLNGNIVEQNYSHSAKSSNEDENNFRDNINNTKKTTRTVTREDRCDVVEALISNKYCKSCGSNTLHIATPEVFCKRGNLGRRVVYTCKICRRTWYKYN